MKYETVGEGIWRFWFKIGMVAGDAAHAVIDSGLFFDDLRVSFWNTRENWIQSFMEEDYMSYSEAARAADDLLAEVRKVG